MKQLLSCLLIVCMYSIAHAQTTIPLDSFYTPGSSWTEIVTTYDYPCPGSYNLATWCMVYRIDHDSAIAGKTYHLVSACGKGEFGGCSSGTPSSTYTYHNECDNPTKVFAMIHTDSNRVYFTLLTAQYSHKYIDYCDTVGEYLFYDYNLSMGSVVAPGTLGSGISVSSIDSVSLSNGMKVSRYNGSLVYGVGAQDGFINYWPLYTCGPGPSTTQYLLCYDNPNFSYHFTYPAGTLPGNLQNDCFDFGPYIDSVNAAITQVPALSAAAPAHTFKVYPNPTTGILTIDDAALITSISITNPAGKVFYAGLSSYMPQIDVSAFPPGIYFIRVNNSQMSRFVKE